MAYNKPPKITGQMPEHHHKDDANWVFSKLVMLQYDERSSVCKAYSKAFKKAFDDEPQTHRKDGKARFEANNRLRIYIKKKTQIFRRG